MFLQIRGNWCSICTLLVVSMLCSGSDRQDHPSSEFLELRARIVDQPRSFENEVFFAQRDGQIVRSDRLTGQSDLFGDFDGDGDVDLHDYNAMQICLSFSGPGLPTPPACYVFDADEDGDIDLEDAAEFWRVLAGPLSGVVVEAGNLVPIVWSPGNYYSGEPGTWGNNALNGHAAQAGYMQDDLWYEWSVTTKPQESGSVIIANPAESDTAYTILAPVSVGSYIFELLVTNLLTLESGSDTTILTARECLDDSDCDDGVFCNGAEICGADGVCVAGTYPCPDNGVFCDGTEGCDETAGACVSSGDPCAAGEMCDEATASCTPGGFCTTDADCPDNGAFCDGTEFCDSTTSLCTSSGDPCDVEAGETCNEDLNTCVSPPGDTIFFTLGMDTSPATDGTGGDDTYSAPLLFNAPTGTNVPSLQTGDNANGGDGTDVLNAQFNFAAATTVAPTLTAIETINITDFGTATTTLSGTGITGATAFNFSNSTNTNPFVVTNLPTLANVGLTNQVCGATLSFAAAATSGASDTATLTLNGLTGAAVVTMMTGTPNGIETLNIVSNTTPSSFYDIAMNGATLTTVNVSGDAALTIATSLDANVTTVNASTATGAVTLTQTNAGAFTFTGGAGNDVLILGTTYGTTDTINGGVGTDTLGGTSAVIGGTSATQSNVTSVEKLRVSDELAAAINLSHFGTIAEVVLDDGSNHGIITNAANGFVVSSGLRGGAVCVGTATLGVTVAGSGASDAVTYTLNDCEQVGAVTFDGVETLNLVSNLDLNGSAADSGTAGQNTLQAALIVTPNPGAVAKVVITGTEQLNLTGAVTAKQIDASGFTQPLIMGANMTASGVNVTGGSGADTLFGSTDNDALTGGAGADTFKFTAGDLSAAPSDAVFDLIGDFAKDSDIFDETAGDMVIVYGSTAGPGVAAISAEGIATFNVADDTLAERVFAAEAGINLGGAAAPRQFAVFEHSTNSYLFVSDGVDGIGANDMLFQITGVTGLTDTTITLGNLTIK